MPSYAPSDLNREYGSINYYIISPIDKFGTGEVEDEGGPKKKIDHW